MKWNNENTLVFMELHTMKLVLWDTKNPKYYKNSGKRRFARAGQSYGNELRGLLKDEQSTVPDRPLVRDPIKTLLEYPYELGVWDFDPVHILILIEV
jgi:hypothetical protein